MIPSTLVTQFGYVFPISLDQFIEMIEFQTPTDGNFEYIRSVSTGFASFEDHEITSDFEKIPSAPAKFENLKHLKESVKIDVISKVNVKGRSKDLNDILMDFVQEMGEPTHLVMFKNLVMPVSLGDFRIGVCGDKYQFCWFYSKRFFAYEFDLKQYLEKFA